ncbi:MAG: hypothetical protein KDD40_10815 [Bdellovibrionales bacterium]|nr:hypothetical protein [Bdellovibrionales bacterium]
MKLILLTFVLSFTLNTFALDKFSFSYKEKSILKVLADYSDKTGTQFVVDPSVKGNISILSPEKVTPQEAFNALSSGLALNGYTIVKEANSYRVVRARTAQRFNLEIFEDLPPLQPERMVIYVHKLKNRKPDDIYRNLRILNSKDGESHIDEKTKTIIITDWVSSIYRINALLNKIDKI